MPILSPKSWPLAIKLSLTITAVVAAVGFMIGAVIVAQDWKRFQDELGAKALLLSEFVAITTPKAMLRKDYWQLYLSLKNMASRRSDTTGGHEVITAMILDTEGKVMAHLHPAENKMDLPFSPVNRIEEELFQQAMSTRSTIVLSSGGFSKTGFQEGVVPIFSDQKYMGVVRVRLSVAQLYEKAKDSAMIVLALVFCFVIIGSGLGTIVSRRMVKPLTAVTQGLEAVGRGEMTDFTPIPINERDEIGRLSVTFNQIMAELAEKKMLEEEIAMSEKLVALGRITAGVAHEVNNPLAGLLNCIDTLRKHPDDKKLIDRYLPVIDQGLHRIKDIVHSLLVGLKIEESHETMSIQHIDKLHDLIKAEIGERNIDIIWENRTNKDLHIPGKIEQIVCNLLKNAVEILPQGGRVVFCMHQNGPQLVIEVSDNGPGIPSNIRNQLFDPFFTTKTNGTGLGLWVVYRLVQSMEGIIEVMSDEDQGTTFHVSVPVITMKAA
ncbi:MAG: HAMP domain-containing histidine kinase [Candidatus Thiodiazotropha sp.]|nr:HAMP domain-containing histidine kinase [Candidatus Thiodiazotropha sp.]MCM8881933.1 HAMP domain-containing histidine kinase [Candidatus Thiodiazotropha sp.]MCM8918600.1 HAMP domain-containing histidine kinase [Candidatus Thiodiazotropha sp.]